MPTVTGVLLQVEADRISLATGTEVLELSTAGEPLPAGIRAGDEVAGWRRGAAVREVCLARIRAEAGIVADGTAAGRVRLDTGQRLWDLLAWPGVAEGPGHLRVCHDGSRVLWAAGADGEVRLPPAPSPPPAVAVWRKLRARWAAPG